MHRIDFLTGLNNMFFLEENYHEYIKNYPKSYVIAIDFAKLKYINDNFGHATGDDCLKIFGTLGMRYFKDSLLVRRSGDEFVFVTYDDIETIKENFDKIKEEIKKYHKDSVIPVVFSFNCGIKEAEDNLEATLIKADITMYYAKNEQSMLKLYDEKFYEQFKQSAEFLDNIDNLFETKNLTYVFQNIYSIEDKSKKLKEIYTRNNYESLFDSEHFRILLLNYRFKKIDFINLEYLFKNYQTFFNNNEVIINIHFQTILSYEIDFIEYIKDLIEKYKIEANKIILSINVIDYKDDVEIIREKISQIKELGFKICLDNYGVNSVYTFKLFERVNIDYIKISKLYLEYAMHNPRREIIGKNIIRMFVELGTIPIFVNIETEEEKEFVKTINEKCYAKGYLFSKEEIIK